MRKITITTETIKNKVNSGKKRRKKGKILKKQITLNSSIRGDGEQGYFN
jgi:hypothetical protein